MFMRFFFELRECVQVVEGAVFCPETGLIECVQVVEGCCALPGNRLDQVIVLGSKFLQAVCIIIWQTICTRAESHLLVCSYWAIMDRLIRKSLSRLYAAIVVLWSRWIVWFRYKDPTRSF